MFPHLWYKSLHVLLISLMLASCSSGNKQPEGEIIERDAFVNLLVDIQLIESMNQTMVATDMEFDLEMAYAWVFREHGVTEEVFQNSINFYSQSAETYEEIYDEVIIKISEREVEFNQKLKESISESQQQSS